MAIIDKTLAFKAYDVRGEIGTTLDADMAHEIARALVLETKAKTVAIGADNRPTSPELKAAIIEGILAQGANAIDLGSTGTEETYFAAQHLDIDAAIQVTASHNPIGDNGMKFILRGGRPVETDLLTHIRDRVVQGQFTDSPQAGTLSQTSIIEAYVTHLLGYIDPIALEKFKILVNPGNGMAGHVIEAIEQRLGARGISSPFIKMHFEPDSSFPNGIPNPLLPENRQPTREMLLSLGADFAVAWDGDFDRCFFFDENGDFVEGYYIVGMLAEAFLAKQAGQTIVHDPRLIWNTIERTKNAGGRPVMTRVGHVFIKTEMRKHDAVYGGEMSAHHYFRDFGYCDSGMIPWLLVTDLLAQTGQTLSGMIKDAQRRFPCSGEVNYKVEDPKSIITAIQSHFAPKNPNLDTIDGIGLDFGDWRLNLRASNTEPLLRLNIESRGDAALVTQKLAEIEKIIKNS